MPAEQVRLDIDRLVALDFCGDTGTIVVAAVDRSGRSVIALYALSLGWDDEESKRAGEDATDIRCDLVDRHTSDYDTRAVRLCPSGSETSAGGGSVAKGKAPSLETAQFIACGANNIRLYRLHKGKQLRFCSLSWADLKGFDDSSAGLSTIFTSVAFESVAVNVRRSQRHFFVGSAAGALYHFALETRKLQYVYHLHLGAITAITVSDGLCITAAADGVLCVWPLDFRQAQIEARHEAPVVSIEIMPSRLLISSLTIDGTFELLNIEDCTSETVLRAHMGPITNADLSRARAGCRRVATSSEDGSIRIWDAASLQPKLHFEAESRAAAETITCVCFAALAAAAADTEDCLKDVLVCGCSSGQVRVLCLETAAPLYVSGGKAGGGHLLAVCALACRGDRYLLSVGRDGRLICYDNSVNYGVCQTKVVDSDRAVLAGKGRVHLQYIRAADCAAVAIQDVAKIYIFSCQAFCAMKIIELRASTAVPRDICVVDESVLLTLLDNGHVSVFDCTRPDSEQRFVEIRGESGATTSGCDWTAISAIGSGKHIVLGSTTGTLTLANLAPHSSLIRNDCTHRTCFFHTTQKVLAHCGGPVTQIFSDPALASDVSGTRLYTVGGSGLMSWTLECPENSAQSESENRHSHSL